MYRFLIICFIIYCPCSGFSSSPGSSLTTFSLPELNNVDENIELQPAVDNQKTVQENNNVVDSIGATTEEYEEFFPNLPLSLDGNILNERYNNFFQEGETEANVGRVTIRDKENDETIRIDQDIQEVKDILPGRKEVNVMSFWLVPEIRGPIIEKEYRLLPASISKRKYSEINIGLPRAVYVQDYKLWLFQEIKNNDINAVRALIPLVGDLNFRNTKGDNPLLYALKEGRVDIARLLLTRGVDLQMKDANKQSVYDIALSKKMFHVLDILNEIKPS